MGVLDGLLQRAAQPAPTLDGILASVHPDWDARDDGSTLLRAIQVSGGVQDHGDVEHRGTFLPFAFMQDGSAQFDPSGSGLVPTAIGIGRGALDAYRDVASGDLQRDAYGAFGGGAPIGPQTEGSRQDAQADVAGRSLDAAGSFFGPGALEAKPVGSLGIFGGRLAKTADLEAHDLASAQNALRGMPGYEDITPASIHRDTGWFPGKDGEVRFEIPDHGASLVSGAPASGKLPEILDHPKLYEAYPHFADATYKVAPGEEGWSGTFVQNKNHIDLAPSEYPDEVKATLLHELQHGIQATEGFARGGDARMLAGGHDAYHRLAGEVEARNVEARMRMDDALREAIPPWATESVRPEKQLLTAPTILDEFFGRYPSVK